MAGKILRGNKSGSFLAMNAPYISVLFARERAIFSNQFIHVEMRVFRG